MLEYSVFKFGNKLNNTEYKIMDIQNNSLFIKNSKDSIVFSFFSNSKGLNKAFDCGSAESKVISFKEINEKKNALEKQGV